MIRIVDVGGRVDRELRGGEDWPTFFLIVIKFTCTESLKAFGTTRHAVGRRIPASRG